MTEDSTIAKLIINSQYIKDLSFENPGAPVSIINSNLRPMVMLNVNVNAQHLQESIYEVVLHVNIKGNVENETLFLLELHYAGLFTIENFSDQSKEEILLIKCPEILFPFLRRIVYDCAIGGGLQPLLLDPIDFRKLYEEHHLNIKTNFSETLPN